MPTVLTWDTHAHQGRDSGDGTLRTVPSSAAAGSAVAGVSSPVVEGEAVELS